MLREGDADGPLLVAVADFKRMIGFDAANACLAPLRRAGRTEVHDGVEYVTFAMWELVGIVTEATRTRVSRRRRRLPCG